jgi:hypothetical protein
MAKKDDAPASVEPVPFHGEVDMPSNKPLSVDKSPAEEKAVEGAKAEKGLDKQATEAEAQDKAPAHLATPVGQSNPPAEDPRGESPRDAVKKTPANMGYVGYPAGAPASHENQPVTPTRYALEMTQWLSLPEADRARIRPPEPPEGQDPHPLAVHPHDAKEDPKTWDEAEAKGQSRELPPVTA